MTSSLEGAYAYCQEALRDHDKDRYLADLFIPAAIRPHAHALHAFSFEIARVRDIVSEPMPGELRHQWWRDTLEGQALEGQALEGQALEGQARGEALANPVAAALIDTIARHDLPHQALGALIEARGFDLYDDPMPDLATLSGYCRDTSSILFRLVAFMLNRAAAHARLSPSGCKGEPVGEEQPLGAEDRLLDQAADEAGLAYAFAGLIGAFARHAARGQLYLPGDILGRHGLSREDAIGGQATPALLAALADWRSQARRHLAAARLALASLPERVKPAFLPIALVEPYLARTERRGYDPFNPPAELPQWRRQWALWRG
ncbi:phytoene synthase [Rhizobiales bacterium GAS113]|nr:phytoene synthase [Rhizobiales bacterium GAS113]